ncbi:cub domain containing protein 7 [Dermatophagoides farinae]|uniref:Cub domain containing protein 7 n=1 Tax=Dermatophagoides farinae TaxID=6954 RepID=A0A9D4P746_DERFA|nr:cub domain containing protein 7 [Dermatophagoides farinae]
MRCSYHFVGHGKERVQVIFMDFDVHKVEDQHRDCEISDSLTAFIVTNGQKEWIDDFCGQELPPRIMSNGHRLTLEFKSLDHDAQPYRRFYKKINYPHSSLQHNNQFLDSMIQDNPYDSSNDNHDYDDNDDNDDDDDDDQMNMQRKNRKKRKKRKRQKINDNKSNKMTDDETNDNVDYVNSMDDDDDNDDESNGQKDNNNRQKMVKNSLANQNNKDQHGRQYNRYHSKGFKASFRFVTNFGIETGHQDSKSVCGFVYNSTKTKRGHFTSPNYPGLYPKDTECHYFFYGNITEKVYIQFVHFDVEGVTPCTLETASDYVEFSNVYTADRRVFRHCGLKHPKSIESDGDFFRVTFKSNGRFDENHQKSKTIKTMKTLSSSSERQSVIIINIGSSLLFLLLFHNIFLSIILNVILH